ncbi:MAG: alpha/beta hydrolase family protein [Nocardioides sp.]
MALVTCDFYSDSLEVGTTMTVVLPQPTESQIGVSGGADRADGGFPVLYLLHGLSDDHSAWTRYTSIERYAAARGLAVVMPAVHRSFYADEAHGHRYWTFVSDELPRVVASFFGVSTRREDTFVAGLSMGGYGALKLGLTHPDRFAAVASLSGAFDLRDMVERREREEIVRRVFDGTVRESDDVYDLLAAADPAAVPRLYVSCGTEEERLMSANTRLVEQATALGLDVTRDFRPGVHEWGLWDDVIQDVIAWLPLERDTRVDS